MQRAKLVLLEDTVRWRIRDLQVTAKQLAETIGVDEARMSRLLKGRVDCDVQTAGRIANAIGMPVEAFAYWAHEEAAKVPA